MAKIAVGDKIGLDGSKGYTHGCRDYAILRYGGNGKATVVEAESCHSCWQVGHDSAHTFATVGDVWDVSPDAVHEASENWSTDVKWEL